MRIHGVLFPTAIATFALVSGGWAAAAKPAPHAKAAAAPGPCTQRLADSIAFVAVPGQPFAVIPSKDGCWFFVSLTSSNPRSPNGVGVLRRKVGGATVARVIPVEPEPSGMVLTHDGALLIGADDDQVVFLDTARMTSGKGDPIVGHISDGEGSQSVYVNCTRDDHYLFVSDEQTKTITVIDLARARSSGFKPDAILGKIPVGRAPVALTFSPDERYLYTTSQAAPADWGWKAECVPEGMDAAAPAAAATEPPGAVVVVDVARAKTDPSNAVVTRVPAGCHPVRLVLSSKGDVAYVTARKGNAVLAFDAAKLTGDTLNARTGMVPVGTAPVGIAVARAGDREIVVVANSNRFAATPAAVESLSVIDAAQVGAGATAVFGSIPAGAFPRELRVSPDGKTLIVSNFLSDSIEFVDLDWFARGGWKPRE
jgi:DNA-binding beta-propeller fold protein YncE